MTVAIDVVVIAAAGVRNVITNVINKWGFNFVELGPTSHQITRCFK